MTENELLERITTNPKVMIGKPVIRGTRLTVEYILNRAGHGATLDDLIEEYPHLTREDIQACFVFAARTMSDVSFMPLSVEAD